MTSWVLVMWRGSGQGAHVSVGGEELLHDVPADMPGRARHQDRHRWAPSWSAEGAGVLDGPLGERRTRPSGDLLDGRYRTLRMFG
jgi:hypothetical protein